MFVSQAFAEGVGTQSDAAGQVATQATKVFPPFDFSYFPSHLFWLAIGFGLFYLFISRVIVPRLGGTIESRRDRIASDLDRAARMKEQADAAVADYERELVQARVRAAHIAQDAGDAARKKAEAERRKIEAELEKKLSDSEIRIAKIRDQAMQNVGSIAEETAAEIVKEMIGNSVKQTVVAEAVKAVRGKVEVM